MAGLGYDIGASFSFAQSSAASINSPFSVTGGGGSSGGNTAQIASKGTPPAAAPVPASNNLSGYLPWIVGGLLVGGALLLAFFIKK